MNKRAIVKTALVGALTAPATLIAGVAQGAHQRFTAMAMALNTPRTGQDRYSRDDLLAIQRQSLLLGIGYAAASVGLMGWALVIGLPGGLGAAGVSCMLLALAHRQKWRWKLATKLLPAAALLLALVLGGAPAMADDGIMAALQAAAENDPATLWLSSIVGEGAGGTAFSALLGWSNSLALAIGSLMVVYNTYSGTLQTAH